MDKYQVTVGTFNKLADAYQEKYMNFDFYFDTYDKFCELVANDSATILEVACGPGNITKYLLSKCAGFKIEGIDLAGICKSQSREAIKQVPEWDNLDRNWGVGSGS